MEYRELIKQFAAGIGVSEIAFDSEGVARLSADDMIVSFMESVETKKLLMWAEVATLPAGHLEKLYGVLLDASFMGRATHGATFAREGDTIYLQRLDSLSDLDVASFTTIVENFFNTLEDWRKLITDFRADESVQATGESPSFGAHDFMQV